MDNMKHRRLQELDRSDFEIVRGEPDIRGWDVRSSNRRKIGEVEELIVDAREKKVRYMVVDLDDNELKLQHRKVLIPIGLAELDQKDDDVLIPNISIQQLGELPNYDRNDLGGDVERRIFSTLDRRTETAPVPATPKPTAEVGTKDRIEQKDEKRQMEREGRKQAATENKKAREEKEERERNEKKEKDEVDPDFYRHEYYNVDNLYKNRLHEASPAKDRNESEYERGLHLWERRSEGTVLPDERRRGQSDSPSREKTGAYDELDEERRMQMIKMRRNDYRQRRYPGGEPSQLKREDEIERRQGEDSEYP